MILENYIHGVLGHLFIEVKNDITLYKFSFNQDKIVQILSPIWEVLERSLIKIGIFGSLQKNPPLKVIM